MKVTCGTCAARYALRFKGARKKLLKLRCQRCASPIVVVHPGAEGAIGGAAEERYHLAIAGGHAGPLPLSEIRARFAHGELPEDTHLWRKGWEDWVPIEELDALLGNEPTALMTTTGREVTGGYEWAVVRPRDSSPPEEELPTAAAEPVENEPVSNEPVENEPVAAEVVASEPVTAEVVASEERPPRWPPSQLVFGGLGSLALAALIAFAFLGDPEPTQSEPTGASQEASHLTGAREAREARETHEATQSEPEPARRAAPAPAEARAATRAHAARPAADERREPREEAEAPLASAEQARAPRARPRRREPRITPPARRAPTPREPAIEWPPPAEPGPSRGPAQSPTRSPANRARTPVPPNPFGGAARPAPEIPDWPTEA